MILAEQSKDLVQKKFQDTMVKQDERDMLKTQWGQELARQRVQQLEEVRVNKQLNADIHDHNIEQKRVKKIEDDKVKESDKKMVDDIVHKEHMLDQLELERKQIASNIQREVS